MVITDLHNPLIHQQLSKAMVEMCIGEMEQIRMFFRTDQSVRDYLLRIRRKTALLIASSCHMGALAAGVPHRQCQALYSFGYNVGMAFQIRDDILDLIGTEQELGKPPGSDIRQGNITLPVIYALQDPAIRPKLLEQIEAIRSAEGNADIADFLELVRRSAGIDRAEELADRFIAKAIRNLEALPDIPARRNLHDIARFIGKRKY
jgi:heptaprenyl diphosphate synthase